MTSPGGLLAAIAPSFGFDPAHTTTYNTKYRNVMLANLSAERLQMIYGASALPLAYPTLPNVCPSAASRTNRGAGLHNSAPCRC